MTTSRTMTTTDAEAHEAAWLREAALAAAILGLAAALTLYLHGMA